jgi:hypothetical protein
MSVFDGIEDDREGTGRSMIEAPRWAGAKEWLYAIALQSGVKLTITMESKGLMRTTIAYSYEGTVAEMKAFMQLVTIGARRYNA